MGGKERTGCWAAARSLMLQVRAGEVGGGGTEKVEWALRGLCPRGCMLPHAANGVRPTLLDSVLSHS